MQPGTPKLLQMKSTDAETVAQELVKIFARMGIPDELLTDQGSNFVSELLNQLSSLLRIRRIKTSPYHPQTDGLVERFNDTLKRMLRWFIKAPGAWDELLPYLLFSYREMPQVSTGFSPFELLYGRHVRGPLDVLREAWTEEARNLRMTKLPELHHGGTRPIGGDGGPGPGECGNGAANAKEVL